MFPFAAEKIDELRKFFPDAKVVYAKEGDNETGELTKGGIPSSAMVLSDSTKFNQKKKRG